jgi:ABC-2 type transport system permease protein
MPGWLRGLSTVNPLSYEVDALRGMLLGTPSALALDLAVLVAATVAAVAVASALLHRLAQ